MNNQKILREKKQEIEEKIEQNKEITNDELSFISSDLKMRDKREMHILSYEDIEKMKEIIFNGYYLKHHDKNGKEFKQGPFYLRQSEFFIFMMNTGIRRGEALALKYSDVDFTNHTISITNNMSEIKKRDRNGRAIGGTVQIKGTPKTKESATTIPINDVALLTLIDLKSNEKDDYEGYILNKNGKPIGSGAITKRFNNLLRQAGVEHCGLHSLRHTFASVLYEKTRGDSKLVSALVRHSSVSFTKDIYIHLKNRYKELNLKDFEI